MKKWIIAIIVSLAVIIIAVITGLNMHGRSLGSEDTCTDTNTKPFYGCSSYEEYIAKRNPAMKAADETFVEGILAKNDNDSIKASNSAVSLAGRYLSEKDFDTSMKRLNQALLIDQQNYNVYWIMATWYGNLNDPEKADVFFDKALAMYDSKYDFGGIEGKNVFLCDAALGKLVVDHSEGVESGRKALQILAPVKASGKMSPICLVTQAEAQYQVGDLGSSKESLLSAKQMYPEIVENDGYKDVANKINI